MAEVERINQGDGIELRPRCECQPIVQSMVDAAVAMVARSERGEKVKLHYEYKESNACYCGCCRHDGGTRHGHTDT